MRNLALICISAILQIARANQCPTPDELGICSCNAVVNAFPSVVCEYEESKTSKELFEDVAKLPRSITYSEITIYGFPEMSEVPSNVFSGLKFESGSITIAKCNNSDKAPTFFKDSFSGTSGLKWLVLPYNSMTMLPDIIFGSVRSSLGMFSLFIIYF